MNATQMTIDGYKTYPRFVFSNSICTEDNKFKFWHSYPAKYELVYRGGQYIYVPIGDKYSSENRGGEWTFPFEGLNVVPYADNFSWNFKDLSSAKKIMDIMNKVVLQYRPKTYSKYDDLNFIRSFVDYCIRKNIEILNFLPDYNKIINDLQYNFNRATINSALKPHYRLDENDNIVSFKTIAPQINASKIVKYDKAIQLLHNKIAKLEQKKQSLILNNT